MAIHPDLLEQIQQKKSASQLLVFVALVRALQLPQPVLRLEGLDSLLNGSSAPLWHLYTLLASNSRFPFQVTLLFRTITNPQTLRLRAWLNMLKSHFMEAVLGKSKIIAEIAASQVSVNASILVNSRLSVLCPRSLITNLSCDPHRCHHLHTNKRLHLPLDAHKHTRICCDHCDHPIVGIGRTSTQTTLASVETTATGSEPQQREGFREVGRDNQNVNAPTQQRPLRVDTSVNSGQLSTIAEGISPARQSSTALVSPRSGDPVSERSVSQTWIHGAQSGGAQGHTTNDHGAMQSGDPVWESHRSKLSRTFWDNASERSLRSRLRRHFSKPRKLTIQRLGINIVVAPTLQASALPSRLTPDIRERGRHEGDTDPPPSGRFDTALSSTQVPNSLAADERNLSSTQTAEPIPQPEPGHPDRLINRTPTQHDKHERIRAKRREETLKREAELRAKCECRSECQCRGGSLRSNAASYGPAGSDRSIQVPDHHLHRLLSESTESSASRSSSSMARAMDLHGIGSHVHFDHGNRSVDDPTNPNIEYQQVFDDRLSQASTAYVMSNGSSISLASRRPSSLRRSNTAPGFPTRRHMDGLRPHVVEAIQNRNIPDQAQGSTSQEPESPRSSDVDLSNLASEEGAEVADESPTRRPSFVRRSDSDV